MSLQHYVIEKKAQSVELREEAARRGMPDDGILLIIDAGAQVLRVVDGPDYVEYECSTSARGLGGDPDSGCTPPGWHRVAERYGEEAEPGTAFVSRQPTGQIVPPAHWSDTSQQGMDDAILSRILRLEGLEPHVNGHTFDRFIYLHGTNREHLLGTPCSHGCIRLANLDIIALFERTMHREIFCWIGHLTHA